SAFVLLFSFRHGLDRTLFNIFNIHQQHHYIWLQFKRDETQQPRHRQAPNVGCNMEKIIINYPNFDTKGKYFFSGDKIIWESVDKLFELLETESKSPNTPFIYRGLSEAKYFIFNSSQREYIKQKKYLKLNETEYFSNYEQFILDNISKLKLWQNGLVEKFFQANGILEDNTIAYLSFMQHYNIPTPLIDFTRNPFVALYFAISDHNGSVKNNSDKPLDDFISIYRIYKPTIIHELFHGFFRFYNLDLNSIPYKKLSNSIGLYLLSNEDGKLKLNNNANIINQEGVFYYNHHPFCPLEVKYNLIVNELKNESNLSDKITSKIPIKIGYCMNIYKKLIPEIREKLNKMGINKDYLFPDFTKIHQHL
ncbi:MAG: FRG domain-containing protein, partial [Sphingobacteriia bacterium]|nr:FRG domain-containing protein [Sphingobacteriia bacterium]